MNSDTIYELLEREGIKSLEDIILLPSLTVRRSRNLHQKLRNAIFEFQYRCEAQPLEDDFYSFMPSASMRGDAGCSSLTCRFSKFDFIARFGALYTDRLVVPTSLSRRAPKLKLEIELELRGACLMLLMLRSLIEAGVAIPAILTTSHCEHERPIVEEGIGVLNEYALERAKEAAKEFDIEYQRPAPDRPHHTVYIHGSEDYIEHGLLVATFTGNPSWIAKSWRYDGDGKTTLPKQTARRTSFLPSLFRQIAADTTFQLFYGRSLGCKYLTTMKGEIEFLEIFNDDEHDVKNALLHQSLMHSLPFIEDLGIADILKLRAETRDSFIQYRSAIRKALKNFDAPLTKRQAREVFRDELEPKINKLEGTLQKEAGLLNKKAYGYAALASVAIALGVIGTLPPAAALSFAGGALAAKMVDTVAERKQYRESPTNDDLYFLLKLRQLGRKSQRVAHM